MPESGDGQGAFHLPQMNPAAVREEARSQGVPGPEPSSYVGKPVRRIEDERLLTGRGSFVADVHLPGMLHAAFLRSPYAHALIGAVDTSAARAIPGVVAVFTGLDLKGKVGPIPLQFRPADVELWIGPYTPLAVDRVRYQGEAVAVVVAEDPYLAMDAADLIQVEYEPLHVVVDQEVALKGGAPKLHEEAPGNLALRWYHRGGNPEGAFGEADVILHQRIVNQRVIPAPIETRAAVASWDRREGRLTLWVTTQAPHEHRHLVAELLGLPEASVRVVSGDVGGGFGAKGPIYPWEVVVCHLARELGRPVKWVEGRSENFLATTHGRDQVHQVELAARRDGTILGLRVKSFANMGAYLSNAGGPIVPTYAFGNMLSGCYPLKGLEVEVLGAYTNTTPVDAYRGAGRPEAAYLVERMVDILAREVNMDPAEIRRRNFIPPDRFPFETVGGVTYDSGDYGRALAKALEVADYHGWRRRQAEARITGRLIGIGLSSYVEICGGGPGLEGTSVVKVHPSGKVTVLTGGHPHGQGGETTLAQIVSDVLGVAPEDVEVLHGDTDVVPSGVGTFASRTTAAEGSAASLAAQRVVEKARRIAADLLEARQEDVVFTEGSFSVKGVPLVAKRLREVALEAHTDWEAPAGADPFLQATASFDPPEAVFPFGTHVCIVEVDGETGGVEILRYVAVDDCGRVINPMLVEGQVHGGVLQGIAQALWEEGRYDDSGNLLTANFMEYLMPTAVESPLVEVHRTVTPTPNNPLGAKGVGEAGAIAAPPAVVNAVVDALSPLGVVHLEMPLTPEKVWRALGHRGKGGSQGKKGFPVGPRTGPHTG